MKSGGPSFLALMLVVQNLVPDRCLAYEQFALIPRVSLLFDTEESTTTTDIKYGNGNGVGLTALIPAWSSQVGLMADYYTYETEAFPDNEPAVNLDIHRLNLRLYYLMPFLGDRVRIGTDPIYFGYGFFYNYLEYAAPLISSPENAGDGASTPFSFESLELFKLHSFGLGGDLIFHHNNENGWFFNAALGVKTGFGDPDPPDGIRIHTDGRASSWSGLSYSVNVGFEKDLVTWCYGFSVGYLGLFEQHQDAYAGSANGRQYLLVPVWLDLSAVTIQAFVRF